MPMKFKRCINESAKVLLLNQLLACLSAFLLDLLSLELKDFLNPPFSSSDSSSKSLKDFYTHKPTIKQYKIMVQSKLIKQIIKSKINKI